MDKIRPQVLIIGAGLIGLGGYAAYLGMEDLAFAIGGGLIALLTAIVTGSKD